MVNRQTDKQTNRYFRIYISRDNLLLLRTGQYSDIIMSGVPDMCVVSYNMFLFKIANYRTEFN